MPIIAEDFFEVTQTYSQDNRRDLKPGKHISKEAEDIRSQTNIS